MFGAKRYPYYFLFPMLIIFTIFYAVPSISSFYYSMTDWGASGDTAIKFIGLENFRRLFSEANFSLAVKNTFIYAIFITIGQNIFGFVLALILNEELRIKNILRTVFFLPVVICTLIIGILFTAILQPEYGVLNTFLRTLHLGILAQDWLGNPKFALFSIIATDLWRISGFAMVIFLAGLQTIPKSILEAAMIDGVSYFQKVRHIIIPLIAQSFTIKFMLSLIGALNVFDIVFALTGGGPGYTTEVFNTFVYRTYSYSEYGYSTAASLILFLFIAVIGFIVLNFLKKREVEL
jgi:raffinose/stachyose/melibiose transport system permease protein